VNAIATSRIGKEDTFLLFFFLLAVWCYERAKRQGVTDPSGAQRWYAGSGVAFGLMLASKYMPGYLPIYALFNTMTDRDPGAPDLPTGPAELISPAVFGELSRLLPSEFEVQNFLPRRNGLVGNSRM